MDQSEYCEVEYRDESGVVISNKTRIVEVPDGSIHRVPIVNKAAMEVFSERRKIASTRKKHAILQHKTRTQIAVLKMRISY